MKRITLVVAVTVLAAATPALAGPAVHEPGSGAGSRRTTADTPSGSGPINSINGNLTENSLLLGGGFPDWEDAYIISIPNPADFSARVYSPATPNPFSRDVTLFDTRLWLFDMDDRALLANDDQAPGDFGSMLLGAANDGTGQTIPAPGCYVLIITVTFRDPVDATDQPMFFFGSPTEISGPDGPGGPLGFHTDWIGPGSMGGEYTIYLEGVEFCPAPGAASTLLVAGATLMSRRRRV